MLFLFISYFFWITNTVAEVTLIILDEKREAVAGAIIQIEPDGINRLSNLRGEVTFFPLTFGQKRILISMMGYERIDTVIQLDDRITDLRFVLKQTSLELNEVTITSRESNHGLATASIIERNAIAHTQPNSLRDVLQVIPGQLAINPSVNTPKQILIRLVSTNGAGNAVAQMGTAIIMDGSPLSNDANLQSNVTILNSSAGSPPPFQSVVNQGFDLRQIPADQIESVEVLRGVGSARHGNFTTGAVIVQTRIGAFKPTLTLRANPNAIQVSGGAGVALNPSNSFSLDLDAMDSRPDPRDIFNRFIRRQTTFSHQWKGFAGNLIIRNRLTLGLNTGSQKLNLDQEPLMKFLV